MPPAGSPRRRCRRPPLRLRRPPGRAPGRPDALKPREEAQRRAAFAAQDHAAGAGRGVCWRCRRRPPAPCPTPWPARGTAGRPGRSPAGSAGLRPAACQIAFGGAFGRQEEGASFRRLPALELDRRRRIGGEQQLAGGRAGHGLALTAEARRPGRQAGRPPSRSAAGHGEAAGPVEGGGQDAEGSAGRPATALALTPVARAFSDIAPSGRAAPWSATLVVAVGQRLDPQPVGGAGPPARPRRRERLSLAAGHRRGSRRGRPASSARRTLPGALAGQGQHPRSRPGSSSGKTSTPDSA